MSSTNPIPPAPQPPHDDIAHHGIAGMPPEEPVWTGRASPRSFWPQYASWLFVLVAVLVLMHYLEVPGWTYHGWAVLVMLIVLAAVVVKQMIDLYSIRYRLTNQRLFIERGILNKVTDQIELVRVDDVGVVERLVPRILGLGDVILNTTDVNDRNPVLKDIRNPNIIAEHIRTNVRNMRQIQRMIYTENVGTHDVGGGDALINQPT